MIGLKNLRKHCLNLTILLIIEQKKKKKNPENNTKFGKSKIEKNN